MMALKGMLWDHDGIVLDTEQALVTINTELLAEYGTVFDPTLRRYFTGKPDIPGLEVLIDVHSLRGKVTAQELSARRKPKLVGWYETAADHVPGFLEYYAGVRRAFPQVPVAVASGTDPDVFEKANQIRNTRALFDGNICLSAELNLRHKPEPDIFVYAAGMIKVAPMYCATWEDSPLGLASSITAGVQKNIALTRTLPKDALIEATEAQLKRKLNDGEVLFINEYNSKTLKETLGYLNTP